MHPVECVPFKLFEADLEEWWVLVKVEPSRVLFEIGSLSLSLSPILLAWLLEHDSVNCFVVGFVLDRLNEGAKEEEKERKRDRLFVCKARGTSFGEMRRT